MKSGSLVALHGFLGHPSAFERLGLAGLAPQAYLPLLEGHGPAPHPRAPTFAAEVERLAQEVEALPRPRRLLGYSQGARIGLGLLTSRPGLFDTAVLIAAQPGLCSLEERRQRRLLEDAWIARLEDEGVEAFVDWWSQLPLFGGTGSAAALRAAEPHRYAHTAAGLVSALLVLGTSQMPNLWPMLAGVSCPIELWVGALDAKFLDIATRMAKDLPHAQLHRFEGAHHNPLADRPEEAQARLRSGLLA